MPPSDAALRMFDVAIEAFDEPRTAAKKLKPWAPQAGPQELLFTIDCDEILFGGAAGGGKSAAIVALAGQRVKKRGYRCLILRRSTPDLKGLIDEARAIFLDGRPSGKFAFAPLTPDPLARFREDKGWVLFPQWGSRIEFGHCHDREAYRSHMGQQYDDIFFDEGSHFEQVQYETIATRRRGTISGIRRRLVVTANPPEAGEPGERWIRDKWGPWINPDWELQDWEEIEQTFDEKLGHMVERVVRGVGRAARFEGGKRVAPMQSGEILYVMKVKGAERFSVEPFTWEGAAASSRTFIRSTLRDNPAMLDAEPNYVGILRQANAVRAAQLELGDWTVKASAGELFRRDWFDFVNANEVPRRVLRARAWDKAATEVSQQNKDPDWTRGVRLAKDADGVYYVEHVASLRAPPGAVDAFIKSTAELDGKEVRIRGAEDPGSAGKADAIAFMNLLHGFAVHVKKASGDKVLRASPVSSAAFPKTTGGKHGLIKVVRGPWNEEFFHELEQFPHGKHDDQVDALADAFDELSGLMVSTPAPPPPITFNPDTASVGW
jgi:predicted phage terminase large subunit-like protein